MADISLCYGEGCPLKENCKRFVLRGAEEYQSYIPAMYNPSTGCDYFIQTIIKPTINKDQIHLGKYK